jgi:sodium-dependent dicarboxylate transporter 2/3/5
MSVRKHFNSYSDRDRWSELTDWWQRDDRQIHVASIKIVAALVLAVCTAYLPAYPELGDAGRATLFILVLAVGFWVTEAMPAFAVGLLVIALEIAILGRPGGVMNAAPGDWEKYAATLGSPLIWLFLSGFVLSIAAEKTGVSLLVAAEVLGRVGERPWWLLAGIMGITFTFSMFISNTAAAAMMIAVALPVVNSLAGGDPLRRALVLGIAMSANLGGMGTIIGSPPNAIAAGALMDASPISFFKWAVAGIPPALVMVLLAWAYLLMRYPAWVERVDFHRITRLPDDTRRFTWQRIVVMSVFTVTVALWMTQLFHGVPATVISFLPICVLTVCGILGATDIRSIRWDVLLLITGGLSLGLAVTESGLAAWLVAKLPLDGTSFFTMALALAFSAWAISNVISNTVAANILVPIAVVAAAGAEAQVVLPLALAASSAMMLPISTPPNAIVHATGEISTREMIESGLLLGVVAPLVCVGWCSIVL